MTQQGRPLDNTECCVGGGGASILPTCVLLTAPTALLVIGTPALDFVVCQEHLYHWQVFQTVLLGRKAVLRWS